MAVRRHIRWLACLALTTVVCAGSGCRLFHRNSDNGGSLTSGTRDPLLGRDRIPATKLPTGRENARGGKSDPLLTSGQGGDEDSQISSDLPPAGKSEFRKDPFRLGRETTAAGLARGSDDPLLAIPSGDSTDRRAAGSNTGRAGPVMLRGGGKGTGESTTNFDQTAADLKRYGVKVGEPITEGNQVILRGELETRDGVRRRYEGAGSTAAAAAADLLEQVRSDQGR